MNLLISILKSILLGMVSTILLALVVFMVKIFILEPSALTFWALGFVVVIQVIKHMTLSRLKSYSFNISELASLWFNSTIATFLFCLVVLFMIKSGSKFIQFYLEVFATPTLVAMMSVVIIMVLNELRQASKTC